ncbi:MAG: MerR family transcriptional regulator [Desulfuromusa sp.]
MLKILRKGYPMKTKTEKLVQIGQLAKSLGITTRTIRYYEEIGLMGATERLGGGTRTYSRDDVLRLKFILKLKELGISLKEMQRLAKNFDINQQSFGTITPKLLEILDGHIGRVDQKIANLASLRKEIVDYRSRISDILQGNIQEVR